MSAPGFDIGGGAIERGLETFDRDGIGAADHHEIGIMQRVAHRMKPLHHLGRRHQRLVVIMAAFFWENLVLEMERRDAGALEGAGGALRGERVAVAGIGVGDHRHRDRLDHLGEPPDDFIGRHQANVRYAGRAGDGAAARIDGRKAGLLDEPGRKLVERAGRDHDFSPAHHGLEFVVARKIFSSVLAGLN